MRIAHFMLGRCNPDSANGVDKAVYYLSSAQAALGHDVSLFSVSAKPALPIPGVTVQAYVPALGFNLPRWSLWRDLSEWRPDIVHIHSLFVPANAVIAQGLRRRGTPYVVTPHGAANKQLLQHGSRLKRPYRALIDRPTLNRAAFVHSVGDHEAIEDYGIIAPLVIAPYGIDASSVPKSLEANACRARLGLDGRARMAVFLGRLDPVHKGLDLLINGFAEAMPQVERLTLVIAGPDWRGSRGTLEELARQRGVDSRIVFWGPAYGKEKFDLLAAADFVVQPSRWEGLPFSMLEAMVVGRPCLASAAADPLKCIARYDAGARVEPTVEAIARALAQFAAAADETLARQGRNAAALVREEFSWPKTARTLVAAYSQYG